MSAPPASLTGVTFPEPASAPLDPVKAKALQDVLAKIVAMPDDPAGSRGATAAVVTDRADGARGAFDDHATAITEGMKVAAATALASLVGEDLREDLVIPSPFDPRVPGAVREAVAAAARTDGVARR